MSNEIGIISVEMIQAQRERRRIERERRVQQKLAEIQAIQIPQSDWHDSTKIEGSPLSTIAQSTASALAATPALAVEPQSEPPAAQPEPSGQSVHVQDS